MYTRSGNLGLHLLTTEKKHLPVNDKNHPYFILLEQQIRYKFPNFIEEKNKTQRSQVIWL